MLTFPAGAFRGSLCRDNDELKPEIEGKTMDVLMKTFSTHTVSPSNRLLIFIHSHPPPYFRQRSLEKKEERYYWIYYHNFIIIYGKVFCATLELNCR